MANTYTQLYIHLVFAVSRRECLIRLSFKDELEKYMTGIVQNELPRRSAGYQRNKSFSPQGAGY